MHLNTLLLLGFIAGATIFIGLPINRVKTMSATWRNGLSMFAAGILVYLLIEILGESTGQTALALRAAGGVTPQALTLAFLLAFGFWLGFVGLVGVEQRLIRSVNRAEPERLCFMIAVGIGLHNLSEGLAIGQAYLQGLSGLTISLIVGFALHNATEGFGIVGPAIQNGQRFSWGKLFLLGLIGGGPTFVGTLLGSLWTSPYLSVTVLAMAGGALLYVLKELFNGVRRETKQVIVMTAVAAGFVVGWSTELAAETALASSSAKPQTMVEADGDAIAIPAGGIGPHLSSDEKTRENNVSNELLHEKAMKAEVLPDGTHRYTLTASVFPWELFPGVTEMVWGYNHQVPGPLLHFYFGEKVEIVVHNQLPQATTVHWHGFAVPNSMDGVPGATQKPIPPGGSFTYRFTVNKQMIGTHLYHSHVNDDFQNDMGLYGPMIVDSSAKKQSRTIDTLYMESSFKVGGSSAENAFMMNGKAYPESPALTVPLGSTVRIRLINASAEENHVMHLHGYTFRIVALDGNPLKNPIEANTVMLGPAQTADVEFKADNPGRWMFHCHILDHMVNPGPNGDGSATHMADMGGLMTYVNVVQSKEIPQDYMASGMLDMN